MKFLIYDGTTQRTCLRLMGRKMLVALMMEGKFSGEGLHSMDADDDMLAAMARELVEKGGVGDSADAVWEELRKERTAHLPPTPAAEAVPAMEMESEIPDMFAGIADAEPTLAAGPVLVHSQPKHCGRQGMSLAISYDSSDKSSGQQPWAYEAEFVGTRV